MANATSDKTETKKGEVTTEQKKPDATRVKTVTPDNENGDPGPPASESESSNKGKGPKGEDL
jgi:hypothetical protein